MFMRKYWTAYNRQISIRTDYIMRKLWNKIKQFSECRIIDYHWCMLTVKYNTMFIVINIWRILHKPVISINGERNNSVIISCRMIYPSGISFIFLTKQTFRIARLFLKFCRCNSFRILFRLWKIYRDINITVFGWCFPL